MSHSKTVTHAGQWSLLSLEPETLTIQRRYLLGERPYALAAAPDGGHVYGLVHFSRVMHLDLDSGAARPLATLPSAPLGIAVTDTRVYVSDSAGSAVQALDRRTGRVAQVIATGRHPAGITLASSPQLPR
jgi:DNA-binding beta-propeller fold protein YncE